MNKAKLAEKFTEIVAIRLDSIEQRMEGGWPPYTEIGRWKSRYLGQQNLPAPFVELNHFRNEVDQFVAMLMSTVSEEEKQ